VTKLGSKRLVEFGMRCSLVSLYRAQIMIDKIEWRVETTAQREEVLERNWNRLFDNHLKC